jgi:poly(hydroxyalkanoate) depolymerase family esterase
MRDFGTAIARLQGLRRKFEGLLENARKTTDHARETSTHSATRLREVTAFGTNPGELRMLVYVPERLPRMAPMVVALHGCGQSAEEYDHGTGWSSLADRLGFAVLYPEQQATNNPKKCFSWFLPGDITRGHGEALSIQQMAEHAIARFGIDRRKVFVTGLSAGGAMAAVMLATYPELFAGGAVIAGLPYGCARSVQQAFEAMFSEQSTAAHILGDRVRAASGHRGPWPKLSIWYGTADPIVKPSNSQDIIRQWTNVHGLQATPSYEEQIGSQTRRVWNDANGDALVEAFSISGMTHGVPLATTGEERCGAVGPFFLDAGISSTHHIAEFWRLGDDIVEMPRAPVTASESCQIQGGGRAVIVAGAAGGGKDPHEAPFDVNTDRDSDRSFDLNLLIAAAFRTAGLPVPKLPNASLGATTRVDPGPIIEAALKAAGRTQK